MAFLFVSRRPLDVAGIDDRLLAVPFDRSARSYTYTDLRQRSQRWSGGSAIFPRAARSERRTRAILRTFPTIGFNSAAAAQASSTVAALRA
jgi:hypothetical protein